MIKKLNFLFIALAVVFITSCSKDDDSSSPKITGDIVGDWTMVDYVYTGTTVTSFQGQTISSDFVGEAYDIDYELSFEENPNNLTNEGSFNIELTTTVSGQTTTQNVTGLSVISGGSWEIVGEKLIIDSNGEVSEMKIEELTESSLILSITDEEDLSQSGATIISTTEIVVSFER